MARSRTKPSAGGTRRGRQKPRDTAAVCPDGEVEAGLVVHRNPQAERLENLRRDHDKLLRDIAKKKAAVQAMHQLADDISAQMYRSLEPLKRQFDDLIAAVGRLFTQLLGAESRLGRREKARVRAAYFEVLADMGIEVNEDEVREGTEPPHPSDHARGEARRSARQGDDDFGGADWAAANSGDAGYSASKPSEVQASTLRGLFRRLAVALHPDKVQDEREKAERTTWMKDVTRAYESGDVARLVEIERTLLAQAPIGDDPDAQRRQELALVAAIKELRRQLRGLTEEHKLARDSMPIVVDLRAKSRLQQQVADELVSLVTSATRELEELRLLEAHSRRFAEGVITLRDFLVGPLARPESRAAVDVAIEDFLRDFGGFAPASRRRSPSGAARR